jgi:hypothetical protein
MKFVNYDKTIQEERRGGKKREHLSEKKKNKYKCNQHKGIPPAMDIATSVVSRTEVTIN